MTTMTISSWPCSVVAIVLQRTRTGKAMRAVSDNPDLAASSGINVDRSSAWCGCSARASPRSAASCSARAARQLRPWASAAAVHVRGHHARRARHRLRRTGRRLRDRPVRELSTVWSADDELKNVGRCWRADPRLARPAAGHPRSGGADRIGDGLGLDLLQRWTAAFGLNASPTRSSPIGLNVQFGYTGLLNFGQAAFAAAGAYGLAVPVTTYGLSFWAASRRCSPRPSCSRCCSASPPCGSAPTTSPSSRSRRARSCARRCARCASRRPTRRHRRPAELHRPTSSTVNPFGDHTSSASGATAVQRYDLWCIIRRLDARRAGLPRRLPAHAQPVGPRREGDPRGRGRGAQPRQEHLTGTRCRA